MKLNTSYDEAREKTKQYIVYVQGMLATYGLTYDDLKVLKTKEESELESFIRHKGFELPKIEMTRIPYFKHALFFRDHQDLLPLALSYKKPEKFSINPARIDKLKLYYAFFRQRVKTGPVLIKVSGLNGHTLCDTIEEADFFIENYLSNAQG